MIRKSALFVVIVGVLVSACAAASPTQAPASGFAGDGSRASLPAATAAAEAAYDASGAPSLALGQTSAATERLVIKNASLSLVVKEPAAAVDSISALADSLGGFVVSSNVFQTSTDAAGNKIMQAFISLRVPASQLNAALSQLKAMAVSVNSENLSGEDVTAQYTDLESQLRNLEAAEAQLQKIMDGATKTEDVLAVYNQLVSVRGQIEQVKGQMKFFRESAAMSLISIDLIPDALSRPIEVGGWKPQGVAKDALEALVRALQGIGTILIWSAVYLLPLGLVIGIPFYVGVRWIARRLRRPKQAPTA